MMTINVGMVAVLLKQEFDYREQDEDAATLYEKV